MNLKEHSSEQMSLLKNIHKQAKLNSADKNKNRNFCFLCFLGQVFSV